MGTRRRRCEGIRGRALRDETSAGQRPPSVLPDISPTRGEIGSFAAGSPVQRWRLAKATATADLPLGGCPACVGEMSGRTEGRREGSRRYPFVVRHAARHLRNSAQAQTPAPLCSPHQEAPMSIVVFDPDSTEDVDFKDRVRHPAA
ncbi:hypothetical protein EN792_066915, partial [Mesorhizobium sp. M00.F.Ca.ET.149.01.1.1]